MIKALKHQRFVTDYGLHNWGIVLFCNPVHRFSFAYTQVIPVKTRISALLRLRKMSGRKRVKKMTRRPKAADFLIPVKTKNTVRCFFA